MRRYGTVTRYITTANGNIPAGKRVLVMPADASGSVRVRHPLSGATLTVRPDSIDLHDAPVVRTWEIPAEPDVDTVWTQDAQTAEPLRWDRLRTPYAVGWRSDIGTCTWGRLLEYGPVTELPRCQNAPQRDDHWPGPCTGWAQHVNDVQAGRFAGLYCPPCRIRAAADAAQDEPLQWPSASVAVPIDRIARLRDEIETGRVSEIGHFLLEHIAEHGTDGIDAQALARRVLDRVDE